MEYSIRGLSLLAGVSARTLRYYDEIGLLRPLRVNEAGYRFYGEKELAILQQILFYRERGFDLKSIAKILYAKDFDLINAMEEHLLDLERQKARAELLIQTVKKTLQHMKGECRMSDDEKFQAFKEKAIQENEAAYGAEARQKYGDEAVDASNQKFLKMSKEELQAFQSLEAEILARLEAAVEGGAAPESEEAGEVVNLHKKWLLMTACPYSPETHRGIASMYVTDARFTAYYDKKASGCAKLLSDAVQHWIS